MTTDGSIDWYCCPRFDSPSVFGALLDVHRGGHFRIRPTGTGYTVKQLYLPDTAVLVTRFLTEAGVGELLDFMPPAGTDVTARHALVRVMRCVRGRMSFEEIGLSGEQLGNFPQAFTHLALIDSAITLDRALDAAATAGPS